MLHDEYLNLWYIQQKLELEDMLSLMHYGKCGKPNVSCTQTLPFDCINLSCSDCEQWTFKNWLKIRRISHNYPGAQQSNLTKLFHVTCWKAGMIM